MFYTYMWLRENGTPYYVGKGSGRRAFTSWSHGVHKPALKERIIVQDFESEEDALSAEKFLINFYGREDLSEGCLRNLTDGGENPPIAWGNKNRLGSITSEETKKKISKSLLKVRDKLRGNLGRIMSEETRKKMSAWRLGKPRSAETCLKVSQSLKGHSVSEETRAKLRAATLEQWRLKRL